MVADNIGIPRPCPAEIDNVALYDRLLASTARADILAVFEALRAAFQDRHLPAFQRCAARGR